MPRVKTLPSQAKLQTLLDYNPLTGNLVWRYRLRNEFLSDQLHRFWNVKYAGKPAFKTKEHGYFIGKIDGEAYKTSRIIFKLCFNIDAECGDHEDGNKQNNRINNLRDVTQLQNNRNAKRRDDNSSGCSGVYWQKNVRNWRASIGHNGKMVMIGTFDDYQDAVNARKQAELDYGYHPNHGR